MSLDAAPTSLDGKVCLVTGASGGIGAAAVHHFAALGGSVYATDIAQDYSDPADYQRFDLLDQAQLDDCCDWIASIQPSVVLTTLPCLTWGRCWTRILRNMIACLA